MQQEMSDVQATKDVLAMASLEVDLAKIEPGNTITVKWRGKPVFIKRRTEEDIDNANNVDLKSLRDPQPDSERVQNPEVQLPFQLLMCFLAANSVYNGLQLGRQHAMDRFVTCLTKLAAVLEAVGASAA